LTLRWSATSVMSFQFFVSFLQNSSRRMESGMGMCIRSRIRDGQLHSSSGTIGCVQQKKLLCNYCKIRESDWCMLLDPVKIKAFSAERSHSWRGSIDDGRRLKISHQATNRWIDPIGWLLSAFASRSVCSATQSDSSHQLLSLVISCHFCSASIFSAKKSYKP